MSLNQLLHLNACVLKSIQAMLAVVLALRKDNKNEKYIPYCGECCRVSRL